MHDDPFHLIEYVVHTSTSSVVCCVHQNVPEGECTFHDEVETHMQDLLRRITDVDPEASNGLRIVVCFDELTAGEVGLTALLSTAAALWAATAGHRDPESGRITRIQPDGRAAEATEPRPGDLIADDPAVGQLWAERPHETATFIDRLVLERLTIAVRARHAPATTTDARDLLRMLLDVDASSTARADAVDRLGLGRATRYRIAVADPSTSLDALPVCLNTVVETPRGRVRALLLDDEAAATLRTAQSSTAGHSPHLALGSAVAWTDLSTSLIDAQVAWRLSDETFVCADDFGGLIGVLRVNAAGLAASDDTRRLQDAAAQTDWVPATVAALVRTGSVRESGRDLGLHHSTVQTRVRRLHEWLAFDPLTGIGRVRLALAWIAMRGAPEPAVHG